MKKFIKDNYVLVIGICLPVLLVIFFMLASFLPNLFVDDPRHDFLFSDGEYGEVEFKVINHKLHFKVAGSRTRPTPSIPHLYRYSAATGSVEEVTFVPPDLSNQHYKPHSYEAINTQVVIPVDPKQPPSDAQIDNTSKIITRFNQNGASEPQLIAVPEVASLTLDSKNKALDGYEFKEGRYGYRSGMMLTRHSTYKEPGAILSKDGKHVPVTYNSASENYHRTPRFIGWIIP